MNIIILDHIKIELAHGHPRNRKCWIKEKTFIDKVTDYEKKFSNKDLVPRPPHWSGWRILPKEVEFWLDGEGRIHERLVYLKKNSKWEKKLLYP